MLFYLVPLYVRMDCCDKMKIPYHFERSEIQTGLSCAKLRIVELKIEDNKILGVNKNLGGENEG